MVIVGKDELLKNMITEEEYEKILRAIRKDYQVISDISP